MADGRTDSFSARVYVVDDDPVAAAFAAGAATACGLAVCRFDSAEAFLADVSCVDRGCLVLDLQLAGMTGLQLQHELRRRGIHLPVIVVSGKGDVPAAVTAMKQAAFDFFQKPVPLDVLSAAVRRAVAQDAAAAAGRTEAEAVRGRHATLSPREKQVMAAVVRGLANKRIALELALSEKTIEVHRGNVMRKMAVDSVAALVRAGILCDESRADPTPSTDR